MRKYLLSENGNFYKANLHCHTTYSDGKRTPEEVKNIYKGLGYSIVAYTDHDILISHSYLDDENFLALHGFEVEVDQPPREDGRPTKCCHICMVALEPDNMVQPLWHRSRYLFSNAPSHREEVLFDESQPDYERRFGGEGISEIMQTMRSKGFFVTYNHPTWSLEDFTDYTAYNGMHAFEMFNGGCIEAGYDDYNPRVYDDILREGNRIYCIGADDNHNYSADGTRYSDSGWAWTVIKADSLDYRAVTRALEDGNFYASEGPEIEELWYEDGKVHVKCSTADKIFCTYDIRKAHRVFDESGEGINEAEFALADNYGYFRITVVDKQGRHACTNAYFKDTLEKM